MTNKIDIKNAGSFEELLDIKYGKKGTKKRESFEEKSELFIIREMLIDARKEKQMTQEELADKIGTKKSYISRIENGKSDIQVKTLFRIFELGLGKKLHFTISDLT